MPLPITQQIVRKTSDITDNCIKTGVVVSLVNYGRHVVGEARNTAWGTAVLATDRAIGRAVLAPLTSAMMATTVVDTLLENVSRWDVSWKGVAIRKVPGLACSMAVGLSLGAAAPEILAYYVLNKVAQKATHAFVEYGKYHYSFHPISDVRYFFSDCCPQRPKCCNKEDGVDELDDESLLAVDAILERQGTGLESLQAGGASATESKMPTAEEISAAKQAKRERETKEKAERVAAREAKKLLEANEKAAKAAKKKQEADKIAKLRKAAKEKNNGGTALGGFSNYFTFTKKKEKAPWWKPSFFSSKSS
jgi:hypothetical protein